MIRWSYEAARDADMSHIVCPECGSSEHYTGYGFAAGGLGSYTICECGYVLEYKREPECEEPRETGKTE